MVTFARRAQNQATAELTTILAGSPAGVLSLAGGFPNPATFPSELLDEIVARLVRDDARVALQYAPCEGIPSLREYLIDRQEQTQGVRPAYEELIVTSGGMECIALACQSLIDPGDLVAVEAPTYLGALMAFDRYEAEVHGVPILEDVAYREISFDGGALPSLWSLAPDVVVQAGTFSKIFCPGVRLGWAAGPREVIAQMAAAKQTTDQCAGGLGQRIVEEYGRAGHFERQIPGARELYASHWRALERGLRGHMPGGVTWSEPLGGVFSWLTLPAGIDTIALRPAAIEAGAAHVPGAPFGGAPNELRLAFSYLGEPELETAASRLSSVVAAAT